MFYILLFNKSKTFCGLGTVCSSSHVVCTNTRAHAHTRTCMHNTVCLFLNHAAPQRLWAQGKEDTHEAQSSEQPTLGEKALEYVEYRRTSEGDAHFAVRVEIVLEYSKNSEDSGRNDLDRWLRGNLELEQLIADVVGFHPNGIHVISGPIDCSHNEEDDEEDSFAVVVVGFEDCPTMHTGLRSFDAALEFIRLAKHREGQLALLLAKYRTCVRASRLLLRDETARTARFYAGLRKMRLETATTQAHALCAKAVKRGINTRLSSSMSKWIMHQKLSNWISHRHMMAQEVIWRRLRSCVKRHFEIWCRNVMLLQKAGKHWRFRSLLLALNRWVEHTDEVLHQKKVLEEFGKHWIFRSYLPSFNRWVEHTAEVHYQKEVLGKAARHWRNRALSPAFDTWVEHVDEELFRLNKIAMFLQCLRLLVNEILARAWQRWRDSVRLNCDARTQLYDYWVGTQQSRLVATFMRRWRKLKIDGLASQRSLLLSPRGGNPSLSPRGMDSPIAGRPCLSPRGMDSGAKTQAQEAFRDVAAKKGLPQLLPDGNLFNSVLSGLFVGVVGIEKPQNNLKRAVELEQPVLLS
jgi:hypothetical protein